MVIDIDHHVADGPFGDIRILDATAAATAELVWKLLAGLAGAADRDLATREIANCLMTGLITDTGSFRFLNVTPRTFELAARTAATGRDARLPSPNWCLKTSVRQHQDCWAAPWNRCRSRRMAGSPGRTSPRRISPNLAPTDADTEGIVNHVRAIRGAQIGILFREVPGKKIRISLRARDGADVNKIANVFGGGGHKLAAGCSLDPPLADVERR